MISAWVTHVLWFEPVTNNWSRCQDWIEGSQMLLVSHIFVCVLLFIILYVSIYKMVVFIIIPWSLVAPSRTLQQWEGNASIKIAPYCHVSHLLPTPSYTVAGFQTNVRQHPYLVSVNGVYILFTRLNATRDKVYSTGKDILKTVKLCPSYQRLW